VDFWLIQSDLPLNFVARLEKVLDGTELGRASALTLACHRRRFIVAHAAARLIIGHRLGVPPGQIRWRYGEHGKPELAGERGAVPVSLSHSGDLAMFAVTRGRRVGVDVQQFPRAAASVRKTSKNSTPCGRRGSSCSGRNVLSARSRPHRGPGMAAVKINVSGRDSSPRARAGVTQRRG
jgi:hypothetical protein